MVGGWSYPDWEPANLPQEVATAFSEATKDHLGTELLPVFYIGEQLVSGKNYKIIAKSTPVTQNPTFKPVVVTIYKPLDGKATITEIIDLP